MDEITIEKIGEQHFKVSNGDAYKEVKKVEGKWEVTPSLWTFHHFELAILHAINQLNGKEWYDA